MGILSALSGQIYHFNKINTPIHNEMAHRIAQIDESIGKVSLAAALSIAQKSVAIIFDPNNGILKNHVNSLDRDKLKRIYDIIIAWVILQCIRKKQNDSDTKDLIKCTTLVLGLDEHKIDIMFTFFLNKNQQEQIVLLWNMICNQIQPELDNEDNTLDFFNQFIVFYNEIFF